VSPVPQIFEFESQQIRTVVVDDTPRFVVADLCTALSLSNPTMSVKNIDEDDLSSAEVTDSRGRAQEVNVVNESGMYQLIFMSRKAAAKRFRKWVTSEVLPALRQTGKYEIADAPAGIEDGQVARRAMMAKLDLSVIDAMGSAVDPTWRESLARHTWAVYKGEAPDITPENRMLMAEPYLLERGISKADLVSVRSTFGKRLKAAYMNAYGREPEMTLGMVNGREREVKGYYERDRFLFDAVFEQYYSHLAGPQQLELGAA
jgi:prophage antirepressor-like protein